MLDVFADSIIHPETSFCLGCDYRVPVMHGLLDKTYINKLKTSPSYSEESFAREYLSIWSGSSSDSWFNFDKLQKYRKIKNPEWRAKNVLQTNQFYLLSVDVGRLNDQTVVCVFKVTIDTSGRHWATLVNLFVLARQSETKTFTQQAIDIKRLYADFMPREIVMDTNGLGVGLADEMIKTQVDEHGVTYAPLAFINDESYYAIQPKDAPRVIYGIKANGPLNSRIHGNAYAKIQGGAVRFVINEQDAKNALLATTVGQKMSVVERVKRLMPHEMTSKLFEEMANLRLKRTGVSTDIVLEQINSRYPKDKYSSFAYGLWRIKEMEEALTQRSRRRFGGTAGNEPRKLTFFN